jgi:hypothetical protein
MMVITRRPAAEPVSSDSATEISATLRFSKGSSNPHRWVRASGMAHFAHLIWPTWIPLLCPNEPRLFFGQRGESGAWRRPTGGAV